MLQCNTAIISLDGINRMKKIFLLLGMFILMLNSANAAPIKIVAAENFYGELASEIGGANVTVQSIISNPNADPHLFTTSPEISKALAAAQIIIYNGAGYDPWMKQMLQSINTKNVVVINVANLMNIKDGANPHIWYQSKTFPAVAGILAAKIMQLNPDSKALVLANLNTFITGYKQVLANTDKVKKAYAGTTVTAIEPVFGYMAEAMGLNMLGFDFQWKIMNGTEPTPKMLSNYEQLITGHKVKVLFYNSQVTDSITANILSLAKQNNIPVVGVTETMPLNTTINKWLLFEIAVTEAALKASK